MKSLNMFNIGLPAMMLAAVISLNACSDKESVEPTASTTDVRTEWPMNFISTNRGFEGDADSRSTFDWPDNTVIKISNIAKTGSYAWARFTYADGWTLYNFNGNEQAETSVDVYYREGCRSLDDYESTVVYPDTCGMYYGSGKLSFDGEHVTLTATLKPRTARLRFATDKLPDTDVCYNYAKCTCSGSKVSWDGTETDTLHFTYDEKMGKYMSQYLYVYNVPVLKIGDMVYENSKKSTCSTGTAGYINLPSDTPANWKKEKYKLETVTDERHSGTAENYWYIGTSMSSSIQTVRTIDFTVSMKYSYFTLTGFDRSENFRDSANYKFKYHTKGNPSDSWPCIHFFRSSTYSSSAYSLTIHKYTQSNF